MPGVTTGDGATVDIRARLARSLLEIHNPIALARRYLAHHHLLGGPDEDDLMDAAITSIVDSALTWRPGGGRSMLSWAWLHMDRDIPRELTRCVRRRGELGKAHCLTDWAHADHRTTGAARAERADAGRWLCYDPGHDVFDRVELRVTLQRWADLAELNPLMRFLVEYAALHLGVYVRDTPLAGAPTPLHNAGYATYTRALGFMRQAAVTGQRRDDRWTRHRGAYSAANARSETLLERLRAVEETRGGPAVA